VTNLPNYRQLARESVARAKGELATQDLQRLGYAALELRAAMEAVTYDRVLAFKDELPPEEYKTWQPRKLMAALVDIDPAMGMTSTLAAGIEQEYGKPPPAKDMKLLGTDHVFTLGELKAHYDAIGSHLHIPSLEQLQTGNIPDATKLRTRCETVIAAMDTRSPSLDTVLLSPCDAPFLCRAARLLLAVNLTDDCYPAGKGSAPTPTVSSPAI